MGGKKCKANRTSKGEKREAYASGAAISTSASIEDVDIPMKKRLAKVQRKKDL